MNLLGISRSSLATSAGFLIEYRDQPDQAIRLLLHEPILAGTDRHIIYNVNILHYFVSLLLCGETVSFEQCFLNFTTVYCFCGDNIHAILQSDGISAVH